MSTQEEKSQETVHEFGVGKPRAPAPEAHTPPLEAQPTPDLPVGGDDGAPPDPTVHNAPGSLSDVPQAERPPITWDLNWIVGETIASLSNLDTSGQRLCAGVERVASMLEVLALQNAMSPPDSPTSSAYKAAHPTSSAYQAAINLRVGQLVIVPPKVDNAASDLAHLLEELEALATPTVFEEAPDYRAALRQLIADMKKEPAS